MNYAAYIESNHAVILGKPVIKGSRITVALVLKKLAEGASIADLITMYPHITKLDVRDCLEYASEVISHELVFPE
ncbi:MAG: DUF433 domain-containing protein [Bacteroidia bacterium]|nr:DUF433 domain-containing protein [Bacteroidia bacterium]